MAASGRRQTGGLRPALDHPRKTSTRCIGLAVGSRWRSIVRKRGLLLLSGDAGGFHLGIQVGFGIVVGRTRTRSAQQKNPVSPSGAVRAGIRSKNNTRDTRYGFTQETREVGTTCGRATPYPHWRRRSWNRSSVFRKLTPTAQAANSLAVFGWAVEGQRLAADGPGHGHGLPTVWPVTPC